MPKVAAHLEEHGVELSAITFGWFLSLFTDSLPIQVRLYSHSCHMGLAKLTLLSLADTAVLFFVCSVLLQASLTGPPHCSRVWDLFFIHGTIFVFRIAVAILKLHEADLLECDSAASLYALLGQLPAGLWNADRLLKVSSLREQARMRGH